MTSSNFFLLPPLLRWTGSKKYVASQIVSYFPEKWDTYFPEKWDTYFEPFLGGRAVLFNLIKLLTHT